MIKSIAELKVVVTSDEEVEYLVSENYTPWIVVYIDNTTNEKKLVYIVDHKIVRIEDYKEVC